MLAPTACMPMQNTGFVPWNSSVVEPASEAMFVRYSQERAKLSPFLYAAYNRQSRTGIPVTRALTVDYDTDNASFTIEDGARPEIQPVLQHAFSGNESPLMMWSGPVLVSWTNRRVPTRRWTAGSAGWRRRRSERDKPQRALPTRR